MGEEGGLLAASETSYHKWRRGRLLQVCVLAPGEGSNAYGHARAMRPGTVRTDAPPQTQRFVLACMGGPAVAPAAHRLYVPAGRRGAGGLRLASPAAR